MNGPTKKIIALLFSAIVMFFLLRSCVIGTQKAWELNARINPAVYPVFRKIEVYAMDYSDKQIVDQNELERCRKVIQMHRVSYISDGEIDAVGYYKFLDDLNFDLPPLYLDKPASEEERRLASLESAAIKKAHSKKLKIKAE